MSILPLFSVFLFSFHPPSPVLCYALIQPAWRADAAVKDALIAKGRASVSGSEAALGSPLHVPPHRGRGNAKKEADVSHTL